MKCKLEEIDGNLGSVVELWSQIKVLLELELAKVDQCMPSQCLTWKLLQLRADS